MATKPSYKDITSNTVLSFDQPMTPIDFDVGLSDFEGDLTNLTLDEKLRI